MCRWTPRSMLIMAQRPVTLGVQKRHCQPTALPYILGGLPSERTQPPPLSPTPSLGWSPPFRSHACTCSVSARQDQSDLSGFHPRSQL